MKYAAVFLLAGTALGQYSHGGAAGYRGLGQANQRQYGVTSHHGYGPSNQHTFAAPAGRSFGASSNAGYQRGGRPSGGVRTLQSSPLPPPGYVSPSAYQDKTEPPKPFAYKYEGPDPYGGYSSHESQGDEYGRITGQYTVTNPDGTSRLVKYVADPETGFHAEVDTDEEGTKTSEPANASIRSSAPEDTHDYGQAKKPYGPAAYSGGAAYKAASSRKAPAYKTAPVYAQAPAYNRQTAYTRPAAYSPAAAPYARPGAYKPVAAAVHRPGAYRATPTAYAGYGAAQNTGAYHRGSNQYGVSTYKAAASHSVPTAYRATGAYRAPAAFQQNQGSLRATSYGSRTQAQTVPYGRRPYY